MANGGSVSGLSLWNKSNLNEIKLISFGPCSGSINAIESINKSLIALGGSCPTIGFYDILTGDQIHNLSIVGTSVHSFKLLTNNLIAVGEQQGTIEIFKLYTWYSLLIVFI